MQNASSIAQRDTLRKFIDMGAMGLPIDEFSDIIFANFAAEIEQHLWSAANSHAVKTIEDVWAFMDELLETNEEHPILGTLYSNNFIKNLIGPEYTRFNRYPEVYHSLFTNPPTPLNIAIIGCAYGQEILSVINTLTAQTGSIFHIDAYNKPSPIFAKLKTNMHYPADILAAHVNAKQLSTDFIYQNTSHTYVFSPDFFNKVQFHELDLLAHDLAVPSAGEYDIVLIHNVLQYLAIDDEQADLVNNIDRALTLIQRMVKHQGIVSIINENRRPDTIVEKRQAIIFGDSAQFRCQTVSPAQFYTKIGID